MQPGNPGHNPDPEPNDQQPSAPDPYRQPPQFGQPAQHDEPPQYNHPQYNDPQFSQPPQYGEPPQYGQPPQYGEPPQYGQPPQYGEPPQYGQQPPSDPFGQPTSGTPYAAADPGYGQSPGYPAPAPGYGGGPYQPGYGAPNPSQHNVLGIIALVLGIVSNLTFCCFGGGALFGVAAIVLGLLGMGKAKSGTATNKNLALTGLILGALGIVLSIAFIAWFASNGVPTSP